MEFKYRSVDDRPPSSMPNRSPPPFIGRFSTEQHATQRDPSAVATNYYPNKYRNDVGVTTLWDVNKERIKGDTISEEFVQGRRLESEVMMMGRETAMRREMGMGGGSYFHENRSMLSNSRFFSMNRIENHWHATRIDYGSHGGTFNVLPPMARIPNAFGGEVKYSPEVNDKKDKLIVTNKVGSKREAVTLPTSDPALYGNNKRDKQDWSSALCQVSATCEITSSSVPMELVYREMSPSLMAYCSPSHGVNFFTEQAAPRAINAIPSSYPQYCNDVGGTIPWDVRREQIKREIVSEELVRREMAMGGRSSFHESRPLLFNSRFSSTNHFENHWHEEKVALESHGSGFNAMPLYPIARDVKSSPEVNDKDKLIILARPDLNNVGSKRKAATLPASDDDKPTLSVNKKRANEEWSCALCQVSATSETTFNEHLRGKKHKANETTLKSDKLKRKSSMQTKAKKLPRQQRKTGIVSDKRQDVSFKKDESATSWRCALCQVSATSKSGFYEHLQGKKHKTKEAGLGSDELKPLPMSSLATDTKVVKELLQQSKTRDDSGQKSVNRENTIVENKMEKVARTGKHKFWCEVCKIGAHADNVMEDHIRGKKHQSRLLQKLAPNDESKNL